MIIQVINVEDKGVYEKGSFLNTDLKDFGMVKQRVCTKVSTRNLLKLKNDDSNKSIYPSIDEFGLFVLDQFIFKSNFDQEYYWEYFLKNDKINRNSGFPINKL